MAMTSHGAGSLKKSLCEEEESPDRKFDLQKKPPASHGSRVLDFYGGHGLGSSTHQQLHGDGSFTRLSIGELVALLRAMDVVLSIHGDRLSFSAPPGVLTPELRDVLAVREPEILRHLMRGSIASFQEPPAETNVNRAENFPLSSCQHRLWFLAQMEGGSEAYHVPLALHLKGDLDCTALRKALDRILIRHEALRTTFTVDNGEPVQRVTPVHDSRFSLIEHDFRLHGDAKAELQRLSEFEVREPFDFETGPVIRGRLIQLSHDEHVLLLTMHHIVCDGWSMDILANELNALYGAFVRGDQDPLPEFEFQYPDYSVWQRQRIESDAQKQQAEFWKNALAGAPALLELPLDHPRPLEHNYAGAFAELVLDEEQTALLKAFCKRHRVTPFMTLLSAWGILMARLSGQTDVLIGVPAANRNRADVENLIGFFANTVVVRLDVTGSTKVSELLSQTRTRSLTAQQYQDIPFEQVVEIAKPARSMAHSPLFQVMFAWQATSEVKYDLLGLEVESLPSPHRVSKFDLSLELRESGKTITGGLEYATSLFEPATIDRYLGYFKNLLGAMIADDAQAIDRLAILPESESRQLLVEWNATERVYPRETSVARLVEAQVEKTPDAIALVCGEQQFTYRELNDRANQLAHRLLSQGVKPKEKVGIAIERSPELIAGILAILKAGAAYVPIDLAYPLERRDFMIRDCGIRFLLTVPSGKPVDTRQEVEFIDASFMSAGDPGGNAENPTGTTDLDSPAYVMYTSGSTGRPKGVEVLHRGIVRLVVGSQYAEMDAQKVFLQLATVSFDASTFEIWGALIHGSRLILSQGDAFDMAKLGDEIYKHGVTTLWLTTSLFNAVVDVNPSSLAPVRQLLTGGEALSVQHVVRALKALPNTEIINGYGPTESTTFATCYPIPRGLAPNSNSIPIGRPIANTRLYILDPHLQPVPIGVAGELYIGGDGLASGYVNLPDLTKERFIADPFAPNERIYKTGDLVRYLPDGNIEFLGRRDDQVKIRGFRIELGEIETRLAEIPEVREAAVIAREDTPGNKRIVAYYTSALTGEAKADSGAAERLRSQLAAILPEYMVPAAFVRLESLPLTANGKLDRKALPAVSADAYSTRDYEPPTGETEVKLGAIWAEVLKVDWIGRNDNFFDLGGHSLMAARAVALMNRDFGTSLPIRVLFQANTISQLALLIDRQDVDQADDWSMLIPIQTSGTRPPLFCVARPNVNALGYLFLSREMGKDQPVYGLQVQLEEDPAIDFSDEQIRSTATEYIRAMKSVQPQGPYNLIGQCQGAYIAFEMVQQLEAAGEQASFLGVLDAWTEENTRHRLRFKAFLAFKRLRKSDPNLLPSSPKKPDAPALSPEAATGATKKAIFQKYFPGKNFVPPVCSAPITVFTVGKQPFYRKNDPTMGWGDRTRSGVTIKPVPGCHTTILRKPYVQGLAALIAEQLDNAARNCR